mgnify:CR=1 FL=1
MLTFDFNSGYTGSLKTVITAFAPRQRVFFMPMAWMRAENNQYQPKHLITAFSESTPLSFLTAFLKKVIKMTHQLTFKNHTLTPIFIDNQPYLRVPQIEYALNYQSGKLLQIYNRHADEFSPEMSFLTTVETSGGKQQARVFSLRGCHLLAIFSKTPVAKEFRRWVLDLIERNRDTATRLSQAGVGKTYISHPSGKKEIVLSDKARDEVKRIVIEAIREEVAPYLLNGGIKRTEPFNGNVTADGLPVANWLVSIIHGAGALDSCISQLKEKQNQAAKLLTNG